MKIKLHGGKPASEQNISALETALGCELSESFKQFLRAHDGAEPETNIFSVDDKNECGVNGFIPSEEVLKERSYIENLPPKALPIAWAEGGNYVFIDEGKNGAVFFWDHETAEATALAVTFGDFLNLLEPFDISTVKLKPGQVKKVWIDPEFLKRLKKQ
jgi:cell wall assembly regulator SMI1